jgi:excisionase family DNA binding protein
MTTTKVAPAMTVAETAAALNLLRGFVYELVYVGLLASRKDGSRYLIETESVERLRALRIRNGTAAVSAAAKEG